MPRIISSQPATSRPKLLALSQIDNDWETIAEAPDYSVPDPTLRWPNDRDPANASRRIQAGQAIITTPLFVHNAGVEAPVTVFVRVLTQQDEEAVQARIEVPAGETYMHPCAGITLVKDDLTAEAGDRLQVRASAAAAPVHISFAVAIGAADQDQPA